MKVQYTRTGYIFSQNYFHRRKKQRSRTTVLEIRREVKMTKTVSFEKDSSVFLPGEGAIERSPTGWAVGGGGKKKKRSPTGSSPAFNLGS